VQLTDEHRQLFDTFGFLVLRGAMKDDVAWMTEEFEQVFRDKNIDHDGTTRTMVLSFIESRERLCALLDHPVIEELAGCLLGPDANYLGSDGNYYAGDTAWHADGQHGIGKYMKIAFYLDPVDEHSGALRVIPGSHRISALDWGARQAARSAELWGIAGDMVPATVLESRPGDVVAFNHNLMHSSWGGGPSRRMFTINLCQHCSAREEHEELKGYILHRSSAWQKPTHLELMCSTASPERMRHLRQVIETKAVLWS
jgi:ectoine hydroxylase-related dioxygenase (phytanoyl-CoA dioxygenase family)